jgi:hypothetical protein
LWIPLRPVSIPRVHGRPRKDEEAKDLPRYAGRIRQGYRPHPRDWGALAELVGVSGLNR